MYWMTIQTCFNALIDRCTLCLHCCALHCCPCVLTVLQVRRTALFLDPRLVSAPQGVRVFTIAGVHMFIRARVRGFSRATVHTFVRANVHRIIHASSPHAQQWWKPKIT
ncbi:hypothetical protein VPH35_129547 [Triticum aestivum]